MLPEKEEIGFRVQGLSKTFGKTKALQNVTMEISPGELHGLIGPDGAGKTTWMRVVLGLLKPNEGEVAFSRQGEKRTLEELRDQISYMPQRQSLYPDLSVEEHLRFFKEMYRISEEEYEKRRERLLTITRLEPFIDRKASNLSGGMYKKLGLMCALLQSPHVLILDEPTNGVDPISRREFWKLLYDLRREKLLIVVSTSYMDEAERCDHVHVLDQGKHLASGKPQDLLEEEAVETFDEFFLKRSGEES